MRLPLGLRGLERVAGAARDPRLLALFAVRLARLRLNRTSSFLWGGGRLPWAGLAPGLAGRYPPITGVPRVAAAAAASTRLQRLQRWGSSGGLAARRYGLRQPCRQHATIGAMAPAVAAITITASMNSVFVNTRITMKCRAWTYGVAQRIRRCARPRGCSQRPIRPGKTRGRGALRGPGLLRPLLALLALRLRREVHVQGEDVAVPHQLDAAARGDVGYEAPRRAKDDAVARVDEARHGDEGAVHLSQLEGHDALPLVAITELDHRLAQILDGLTAG